MNGISNEAFDTLIHLIRSNDSPRIQVDVEMESNMTLQNNRNSEPPVYLEVYPRVTEVQETGSDGLISPMTIIEKSRGEKQKRNAAVVVRGAYKSYTKSTLVLNNFNMTVNEGTIYSLLGSSGCGKTTILSAIVGIKNLDRGEIRVFGETPGTPESGIPGICVGHMPQEYALYPEFSVQESFRYYGFIYGMSRKRVQERSEFLIKFLDLPKPSRRISTLSGGQKRRVSLAIAMIHEPKLLILDEPTVGVDHLIRESIWNQLHHLVSNEKTTVIITTHYIEESRGSDTIGLMRNGRLLTEKSPTDLLTEYNVTLLEDVVLSLSRDDAEIDSNDDGDTPESVNPSQNQNEVTSTPIPEIAFPIVNPNSVKTKQEKEGNFKRTSFFSRLQALVTKNIILLVRNVLFLLFNFFSPSLQIVVVCLAIGTDPKNLRFGVVNHENPFNCENFVNQVTAEEEVCIAANWSCKFMHSLPDNDVLNLIPYADETEALENVKSGYIWGYMSFPENFSQSLQNKQFDGVYPTNESLDGSTITFKMDMTSQTIGTSLQRTILISFQKFASQSLQDCNLDPRAGELPIQFDTPVYGTEDTTFREYLAPSILLGLLFFFPLCSSGITYITERKAGTLDRSLVAGVTTFEIMIANLVTQTLVLFVQTGFAFIILTVVFQIPIQGSTIGAIVLVILIGIGGMSMGFLISTFCHEEIQAVLLAMGTFFPHFMLAGMVWPSEGMPIALQYMSYLLPCTLACESMRSIISRGWSVTHVRVWPGFVSTIAWICIYWMLTIYIHKMSHRRR